MGILIVTWVLFLLFLVIYARNDCPASDCGYNSFSIRFPFNVGQQPQNCGYPGFDLSCTWQGIPILSLPYSGDFYVRDINYLTQEIQLYDPNGCLPRRLFNLNLSSSPFMAAYSRNYTFLSCSSDLVTSNLTAIDCLSNSTTSIVAISPTLARAMNMCAVLVTLPIPISWPNENEVGFQSRLDGDLLLSWDLPSCSGCEAKGEFCGFANSTSREVICFDPVTGSRGLEIFRIIALSVVIPAVSCSVSLYCYKCVADMRARRLQGENNTAATIAPQPTTAVAVAGLDDSTIETYEKVVLGESRRLPGFADVTCPICLQDYRPKDAIRCIPDCRHCFHADCIDEWLRSNGSCPVCRNSPSPATLNS
ncbi:putative RING-H2 finger protein ATL21A [Coffea arabica]|uniref:RING-H2 finger protein ATL21A n=1 Tax=Coffea arabica TaxID=13443 RepID=A0A6P6WJ11_COFAR